MLRRTCLNILIFSRRTCLRDFSLLFIFSLLLGWSNMLKCFVFLFAIVWMTNSMTILCFLSHAWMNTSKLLFTFYNMIGWTYLIFWSIKQAWMNMFKLGILCFTLTSWMNMPYFHAFFTFTLLSNKFHFLFLFTLNSPTHVCLEFLQISMFMWYIICICLTWYDIGYLNLGDWFYLARWVRNPFHLIN